MNSADSDVVFSTHLNEDENRLLSRLLFIAHKVICCALTKDDKILCLEKKNLDYYLRLYCLNTNSVRWERKLERKLELLEYISCIIIVKFDNDKFVFEIKHREEYFLMKEQIRRCVENVKRRDRPTRPPLPNHLPLDPRSAFIATTNTTTQSATTSDGTTTTAATGAITGITSSTPAAVPCATLVRLSPAPSPRLVRTTEALPSPQSPTSNGIVARSTPATLLPENTLGIPVINGSVRSPTTTAPSSTAGGAPHIVAARAITSSTPRLNSATTTSAASARSAVATTTTTSSSVTSRPVASTTQQVGRLANHRNNRESMIAHDMVMRRAPENTRRGRSSRSGVPIATAAASVGQQTSSGGGAGMTRSRSTPSLHQRKKPGFSVAKIPAVFVSDFITGIRDRFVPKEELVVRDSCVVIGYPTNVRHEVHVDCYDFQNMQKNLQQFQHSNLIRGSGALIDEDDSWDYDRPTCVICLSHPPTHVLVPCGHKIICEYCVKDDVLKKLHRKTCMTCNMEYRDVIKVYE